MKFSEIIKIENINIQNAFLLGLIYSWPIFSQDHKLVLAYSSYRPGDRSEKSMKFSIDDYYQNHIDKLKNFLGDNTKIELNLKLKELYEFTRDLKNGVSVVIDFDIEIPNEIDPEIYLYGLIEKWLIDADNKNRDIFLIGVMDGRGSLDFTGKYISIDIARKDEPDIVRRKYNKYNDIIGTVFNFNPRLTQENSNKKNDQFRLKIDYFVGKFGLFAPFKIDYYENELKPFGMSFLKYNWFFIDKRFENARLEIASVDRNLRINDLAIKLKDEQLTDDQKKNLINEYKIEFLTDDTEEEILYSSQNLKETSKKNNNYLCEYDKKHITFNAKSNNKNYVEAHHFIPFSERSKFNVSIDVEENIVCLCPNCHRKIHLAVDSERKDFIEKIFNERKDKLEKAGIVSNLNRLFEFYKIRL